MPTTSNRPSLSTTLEQRYANQNEGGTFNVKSVIGAAGQSPTAGESITIDQSSAAKQFFTPSGFLVKEMKGVTQMSDCINSNSSTSPQSKQLSVFLKGFSNQKYSP